MDRAAPRLRIGLAQVDSRLGDLEGNVESHLRWIGEARAQGVDLLLFPELSLTGYRLLHLTPRSAQNVRTSPWIPRLLEAAGSMSVVAGFVEEDDAGVLFNSALFLHRGEVAHVHRKVYLPSYGIFQEGRFFGEGQTLGLASLDGARVGMLICEDLWHAEVARRMARAGAKLLCVISASPGRIGPGEKPESQEDWETLTRSTALLNTCWVVYCNRVGWEEGSFYTGGSHIVRPGGEVMIRAPYLEEHLLVTEIDLREVDRLRWKLPLLRAERHDLEGP
jgi:predicted amidohydrolase